VRERALSAHPLCGHRKMFVMLHAYIDDSGTHEGSYACVVAGYFGGVNRWKEFERRWKRVLDQYNVGEFHAHDFWRRAPNGHGVGEYRGWSKQRLDEFLNCLVCVIEGTAVYPFAFGVLRSVWQSLSLRERKILSGGVPPNLSNAPSKPIFFPFQVSITRVTNYCRPGIRIHFFFDDDKQTRAWATSCYDQIRNLSIVEAPHFAIRMGDLTFADSRLALPLQAADLLAYEANRYCKSAGGDPTFPASSIYRRALKRIRSKEDFWLFDHVRLQNMIKRWFDEEKV